MPSKDSWGGPIASEPPFAEALRQAGVDVREEVYVYGDKEKPTPFFERINRVLKTALRFRRILKKESFDLIHLNTALDLKTLLRDTVSIFLMKPRNAKIFLKIHGSESRYLDSGNLAIKFLRNYLNKKAHGIGVHTREEKQNFLRGGFLKDNFYFVKNAVTIAENLPNAFERIQKEKNQKFELLFVSRFIRAKGLIETIRACAILRDQGYNFVLNCLGDGEMREAAEREVARLDLRNQVNFTGYIPESKVTEYFFKSDIFVFPTSHAEGFPNVLFKAVAVGLPVVTTKVRASADYLSEPENCLYSTQEPENIAKKIIELIENKILRETMSGNNIAFGKTLLPENIAREFIEIYTRILEQNPKPELRNSKS